jgi:hypothetical protein
MGKVGGAMSEMIQVRKEELEKMFKFLNEMTQIAANEDIEGCSYCPIYSDCGKDGWNKPCVINYRRYLKDGLDD